MDVTEKPKVQEVDTWIGKNGSWQWSYRLGNKIVQSSVWRVKTKTAALRGLDAHLKERGLSR